MISSDPSRTPTDPPHILMIEDEENISSFAQMYLEAEGFRVTIADRGDDGLAQARAQAPSLVIVDLMLPGIDGYEITRQLRAEGSIPIIMLTARDDPIDMIVGLELGADDYVTKPFNPRELVARVRALLRRADVQAPFTTNMHTDIVRIDSVEISVSGRAVTLDGTSIALTPKEFDLLTLLATHRGIVLSREELLEKVWGYTFLGDSRTIDVHIRQLRRKLGDACQIETVWGTGYKIAAD